MKKLPFPLNYFYATSTPTRMFEKRHTLSPLNMVGVIVFIFFLMMNVVVFFSQSTLNMTIEHATPEFSKQLTEADVVAVQHLSKEQSDGQKSAHVFVSHDGLMKVDTPYSLVFGDTGVTLNSPKNQVIFISSSEPFNFLKEAQNKDELFSKLDFYWEEQTTGYRRVLGILLNGALVGLNILILVFMASLFIWLTRYSHLSSIRSYKESLNLTLNAIFPVTLVACLVGIIRFDLITMIMVQSLGLVIMYLLIFLKTRFSDEYLASAKQTTTQIPQ